MVASQKGEAKILEHWWPSWFGIPMQICSSAERAVMPGMLEEAEINALRSLPSAEFDVRFVKLMIRHHAGAVAMSDAELRNGSDLRLRIMAHAVRHEQQGEIALMNGASGTAAVQLAVRNMFADNVN